MKKNENTSVNASNIVPVVQATDSIPRRVSSRRSSRSAIPAVGTELSKSCRLNTRQNQKVPPKSTPKTANNRSKSAAARKVISLKRKPVDQEGSIVKKIKNEMDVESKDDDEFINASDVDDYDDDDEVFVKQRGKRRRTKDSASSNESWDCPHCSKKFGSSLGRQYHVDMFVCQPSLRPGGSTIRKGRRKVIATVGDSGNQPTKAYKKIRGKINDRTCPQCRRVFTSVAGMQYHRDKRVCEQGDSSNTPTPFDTLTPGLCFITRYGVVEVVNDDRAIPYYVPESSDQIELTANLRKQMKMFHNAISKRQAREQKHLLNVATMSLARRILLREAYDHHTSMNEKDTASFVDAIRHTYLVCSDVPHVTTNIPKRKEIEDPSVPTSSFPNRIVECKLLPDQRPRFIGNCEKGDTTVVHNFTQLDGLANTYTNSNKIFIQRRFLTAPYNLDNERYYCPTCFQCFTSKPGYKYHVDSESCIKKTQSKLGAIQQQLAMIESRALQIVDQNRKVAVQPLEHGAVIHDVRYQQCKNENNMVDPNHADKNLAQTTEIADADNAKSLHPDTVIAQLEAELYRAIGQTIGPIYPEVWIALGYRKASNKVKKIVKRSDDEMVQLPAAAQKVVSGPTSGLKPIVPIIDIRPLVQEIDAGRYPSMKRFIGEGSNCRDTLCAICKVEHFSSMQSKGQNSIYETLLSCDFCRQVEHYACAITKFTVKYPEPCDDFMCHNCIGVISTRRTRAERRRFEKLLSLKDDCATLESLVVQQPCAVQTKQSEVISLINGIVPNREVECVAAQGRRLDELYILLRDAQARLSSALDVEDINENRLSLIETLYRDTET